MYHLLTNLILHSEHTSAMQGFAPWTTTVKENPVSGRRVDPDEEEIHKDPQHPDHSLKMLTLLQRSINYQPGRLSESRTAIFSRSSLDSRSCEPRQ
jgi:hypothetical protein